MQLFKNNVLLSGVPIVGGEDVEAIFETSARNFGWNYLRKKIS